MALELEMLAYCGLYCLQCSTKLAHDEHDLRHTEPIPFDWAHQDLAAYDCGGCKGRNICGHCDIRPCAVEKGVDSCADCADFPCAHIEAFENDGMAHHKQAVANLRHIQAKGLDVWYQALSPTLSCAQCGQKQSWYFTCPEHTAR